MRGRLRCLKSFNWVILILSFLLVSPAVSVVGQTTISYGVTTDASSISPNSSITIYGGGTLNMDVDGTFSSITIANNGTASITGAHNLTVTNNISFDDPGSNKTINLDITNTGIIHCNSFTYVSGNGNVRRFSTILHNGTLSVDGSNPFPTTVSNGTITYSFNINGTTVNYLGADQTVLSTDYYNLTLSGSGLKTLQTGTKSIGGNFTLIGSASTTAVTGLTIGGDLTIGNGTNFNGGSYTHTISGNWVNNGGTFNASTGKIVMNGINKTIGGTSTTTFNNLELGNGTTTTINLGNSQTINGSLNLNNVQLKLFSYNCTLGPSSPAVSGSFWSGNMVVADGTGQLRKVFTGTGYYTFPIGDVTNGDDYTPITLKFTSGTFSPGAYVGVRVTDAKHPNNNSDYNYLTRYWTVSQLGISGFSCDVSASYIYSGDVVGQENLQNAAEYSGAAWSTFSVISSNTLTANGVSSFGDFTSMGIPTITPSVSSLSGFTYVSGYGPSSSQNFTVYGVNLSQNITVTAPPDYEVSFSSNSGYQASLTLSPSSGVVSYVTVFVRLKAGLVAGNYNSENIVLSSPGATSKTISLTGTVTGTAPTTITTGTIAGSPFCPGASVSVPYAITGTFNSGNIFTAQLSDGTGSFSNPTNIGTLTSTTAGTITAMIPGGQAAGTGYRIRVVSSDPSVTGSDNGTNLTVNSYPSAAGTISGTSSVTQGQTGVSYSVPAISNATSYVWSYSGTGVTINGTGNAVTVDFSGSATSGNLTVYGTNSCGNGTVSAAFPITVASLVKSFWYKANQGTSTTTDNSGITSWADQSGQGNDATSQNTAPVFRVSGWNFNPKVNFSSGYFLTARNGISDDMTFFAVYNSTQNTGSTSFWQTPAIIGGETSGAQNDYTLSTNYGRLYFKGTFGDNFGAQTTDTYNDGKVRIVSVTRQKSASGTIYLYVNGAQAATAPSDNTSLTGPTKLGIGNHFGYQATAQFVGDISEVFGINNVYSATQRQGFESYLAIKYGISLGSGSAPVNYMNSAGTIIWTGNSTYQNDVHGIGRDDVYGLDQRSSRSENPGTDILTIQSGSTFSAPTNAQSGTAISDQQFLLTGHNNGSITTVSALGSGINVIARKWYAQVTNSLATESFQFDLTGTNLGAYCKIGLLIADDENLSTNRRFVEGTLNSSILTVNDAAISGNKYFTVATLLSPTIGAIASNQTICSGDTPASLTSETTGTGFGTISYQWESSADGSNWNIINGETNSTYSPGALTQTTYYRRKTLATLGNISCISGETNVVSVTVNAPLSGVTITPANGQTLCATGTGTQLAATEAGGGTITSRQWGKRSVSGGAITNISGATGNTYTPIASDLGSGTWYLVCTSVPECGSAIVSNEVPVTVYSPFTAGTIATTGESICYGADPGTIGSSADASGGDGSITYKWQANGVDIASSNSATFNPPAGLTSTTTYTRWAKDNTCNTSFTQSVGSWVVTVNPIPSAPTTTDGMICVGSNAILSASGATSGQIYNWYTAGTGGTPIKTSSNYTDNTYTTPTLSATTNYWVSIVNTVTGCESARTQVAAIYPVVSGDDQTRAGTDSWIGHVYKRADAIGQAPTDANAFAYYYGTITESSETFDESFGGATTCLPLTASESPRSIYTEYFAVRFRMNSTRAAGIYLADIGSDDGVRLTVDGNLVYNQWVQRGYTINPKVLFQLSGTSNLLLEYYESAVDNRISFQNFTKVPNNLISGTIQTICSGTPGSAITANNALTDAPISNTSGFTVTYQWQQSADQVNWSDISGATAQNYSPTGLMTGTYYFRRKLTVSRTNPGTINVSAVDYSSLATVTVRPVFTAGSIATTGETICYGGDPGIIGSSADASGGDGVITYKWQANGVDIASSNSATFNPPAGLNTTTTYTRWAKDNTCNTSFTQSAGSWAVTVNPQTSITSQSTSGQTVCLNENFIPISVSANGTGTLGYQWYSNSATSTTGGTNLGNANGAQTNTYTPQASSPGTLYYYCVVTGTCGSATSSVSGAFVVNALPVPSFTVSPGAQECQNDDVVYTTQSGQANYVWNVQGTAGVDYSITSGGIGPTSYTVAIKWLTTGNKTVTVNYDNSNGCSGATAATSTTTIDPIPEIGSFK